jgi:hypothetical protein
MALHLLAEIKTGQTGMGITGIDADGDDFHIVPRPGRDRPQFFLASMAMLVISIQYAA